jgi:hypothetical protein
MAQIAIARPLSALSNSGYRSNFTSSPTIKDTIGFGLPSKVVNGNVRYERPLGDSEQSYYFQSRAEGVNDMYLHLGFRASAQLVQRTRVRAVWAILRVRHPLLASKVVMRDYDAVSFVYTSPRSSDEALMIADENLEYRSATKDELINSYLNGPRTLSDERLSYLILSQSGTPDAGLPNHDILICATHFLGDGMALHQFANDFFSLLASSKTDSELETEVHDECRKQWSSSFNNAIPDSLESRLPEEGNKLCRVVAEIDFKKSQEKLIGGHAFPRRSATKRHTVVPTASFDVQRTKAILKNCKAHGVSVSAALFAICNIAWARLTSDKPELPVMMYSALNLRPYLNPTPTNDSYWFLAVGYFNIIFPNFVPKSLDIASTFWQRAKSAKEQSTRAGKYPMIVSRSRLMARERGRRSRAWAREDDEKERGTWVPPEPSNDQKPKPLAPSTALIGLSLLGNLDGMYKHANFADIKLHTLTTGSRQRSGGMLLFGYTFAGKLWVSLGYDENGFDQEVVQTFWRNCLNAIDNFL